MTPLSSLLPLRSSTIWGGFRKPELIPHRYGRMTGKLIQYNAERTLFVWADHPVESITDVTVGDAPVSEWDWSNTIDSTGRAIAIVRFGQPVDAGVEPIAMGYGKLHPATGARMESPAAIVWDILANIAGRPVNESELDDFRDECARLNITIGGSVHGDKSAQTEVRGICESIGAIFCADSPGLCQIWPGGTLASSRATVTDGPLSAVCDLDDLANDMTIEFDSADSSPRQTLRAAANDSIARYGSRVATHEAPWINEARVAYGVAERLLRHYARPQWVTNAECRKTLRVGEVMTLAHAALPIAGNHVVLSRTVDFGASKTSIEVSAPVGSVPAIALVSQSSTFPAQAGASGAVTTIGDERQITLIDDAGMPYAGAAVTLRGSVSRYTNAAGVVQFPVYLMPAGTYWLDIITATGEALQMQVTIT